MILLQLVKYAFLLILLVMLALALAIGVFILCAVIISMAAAFRDAVQRDKENNNL
mgnify:CR=1 FL=1